MSAPQITLRRPSLWQVNHVTYGREGAAWVVERDGSAGKAFLYSRYESGARNRAHADAVNHASALNALARRDAAA